MRKNKIFSSLLAVAAVLCVSGQVAAQELNKVEAANISAGTYVYYEVPATWTSGTKVQIMIGHGTYSVCYEMKKITNTDIYYVNMPKWDGYTQYGFMKADAVWGGEGNGSSSQPSTRIGWAPHKTETTGAVLQNKGYNLFGGDGEKLTYMTKGASYTNLNLDVKAVATDGGTASVSGYKLSSATASTLNSGADIDVLKYTDATFTAKANEGYEFVGWYDAQTEGTLVSSDASYVDENVYDNKTLYARFEKIKTVHEKLGDLLGTYYNDGYYNKHTIINVKRNTTEEIKALFHAGVSELERNTAYEGDSLTMTIPGNDEYSSTYGTDGNNMPHYSNGSATPDYVVEGTTMEEKYVTLHDIKDTTDVWTYNATTGEYKSTDATVIDNFRLFTAPLWLAKDSGTKDYIDYTHVTVHESNGALILRLYVDPTEYAEAEDEGKITNAEGIFSEATITLPEA